MNTKPRRRWFQISLRTLFVGMTLASIAFGWWVHRSREWIRQRHELINEGTLRIIPSDDESQKSLAPGGLWLFGEAGVSELAWMGNGDDERPKRLFPEASILNFGNSYGTIKIKVEK